MRSPLTHLPTIYIFTMLKHHKWLPLAYLATAILLISTLSTHTTRCNCCTDHVRAGVYCLLHFDYTCLCCYRRRRHRRHRRRRCFGNSIVGLSLNRDIGGDVSSQLVSVSTSMYDTTFVLWMSGLPAFSFSVIKNIFIFQSKFITMLTSSECGQFGAMKTYLPPGE